MPPISCHILKIIVLVEASKNVDDLIALSVLPVKTFENISQLVLLLGPLEDISIGSFDAQYLFMIASIDVELIFLNEAELVD